MGTAQARINAVFLKFSWDKDLQLFLHDEQIEKEENSRKYLAPNEEFVVQKRLPEPPSDTKEYFLTIKTEFDNTWHKEEKFELCRSIEAKKD